MFQFFFYSFLVDKYHYIVYTLTCGSLENITQFQTTMSKINGSYKRESCPWGSEVQHWFNIEWHDIYYL